MEKPVKHQTRYHPDHPKPKEDVRQISMFGNIIEHPADQYLIDNMRKHEITGGLPI